MSKPQVSEIEIDEFRLEWDEIAWIAGDLFDSQEGGSGGLRWAKSAWQVLSEAGLNRYLLEVERIVCILQFIAIFALYSEFCVRAFGEGPTGEWEYVVPAGLIGDYPLVDAFSLGQLTQQRDMFVNNGPPWIWDVRREVITLQAKVEYRQVLKVNAASEMKPGRGLAATKLKKAWQRAARRTIAGRLVESARA